MFIFDLKAAKEDSYGKHFGYRVVLRMFLHNSGYSYGSLKSVGYAE